MGDLDLSYKSLVLYQGKESHAIISRPTPARSARPDEAGPYQAKISSFEFKLSQPRKIMSRQGKECRRRASRVMHSAHRVHGKSLGDEFHYISQPRP